MKKESIITIIYGLIILSLIVVLYVLLMNSIANPFIFSEWSEFLIIVSLSFPFFTLIFSIPYYFKLKHATPLLFSGVAFLFFQGAWIRYQVIQVFMSSAYFFAGMLLIGLALWLESDLLMLRYPEAFEEKEEDEPEPMDVELTDEDYEDEVKFWIKMLESKDKKFREEAIISLGEIGDERAIPYLREFIKDESESKSIRELSEKAIKMIERTAPDEN